MAYVSAVQCANSSWSAADTVLEDNYFDMNAGERRVRILRGRPEQVRARSVWDIR